MRRSWSARAGNWCFDICDCVVVVGGAVGIAGVGETAAERWRASVRGERCRGCWGDGIGSRA